MSVASPDLIAVSSPALASSVKISAALVRWVTWKAVHTLVVNAVSGLTPAYIVLPTIALAAALMPSVASCVGAATKFTPNVDESAALTALTLTA